MTTTRPTLGAAALVVLTLAVSGCASGVAAPTTSASAPSAAPTESQATPAPTAAPRPTTAAPDVTVAPPAPEPPAWAGPQPVDTSDWQTFTMPGGQASFRLPPTWEVRDVHPFSPGTAEAAGYAHVYTEDGEHLLGLQLDDEPFSIPCDGPDLDSRVLHEQPIDLGVDTAHGGELATEVRFDAIGVSGSLSISLTDGQVEPGCSTDASVDLTPGVNGVAAVEFGSGSPGPSLVSPPSFAGYSSAARALELVDQERVAAAWAIVRSLEVTP